MSNLFRNKYRVPSTRLEGFDYGSNAAYFVTICTKDKVHFFGEIVDIAENSNSSESTVAAETPGMSSLRIPIVKLSDIGKIVETEWLKTPGLRPDMNLELGTLVVMPNHFHAIIIIGENPYNSNHHSALRRDDMPGVSSATMDATNSENANNSFKNHDYKNEFSAQSKNLASIIRGFKSAVTMQAKNLGYHHFAWQTRYHEHIIRDQESYQKIEDYILNNVYTWQSDKFYTNP